MSLWAYIGIGVALIVVLCIIGLAPFIAAGREDERMGLK